ncbi:hypothetical protein J2Z42_001398 [Clostridium algifaecis]|uniref:Uncharacterized protein n=1 Tax=Clostridium algifaecis TaxID=1472040 RepID=A0ABS4KV45_9CLOT|nr:hypothetical protein [Clostridium algifaecis]MBP2032724.1 hypothetical protein [Clostridium algifaecis]
MYNNIKLTISEKRKNDIKNNLLAKIIFSYKNLTKSEREILKKLNTDYMTVYYAIYNKINSEVEAQNNMAWIKRAYCFLNDELKSWKKLEHEWTEIHNKNLISIRKNLELSGDEILNEDQITKEEYEDLMYLQEQIDMCDKSIEHIKGLFISLNNKLIECCKYIENISFDNFCSLIGINRVTALKNLKDDFDYTKDDYFPYYYSLLWWGIEDAREEDGWKSNRNGMPYFYLCTEAFIFELDRNKEVKKKVDDYLIYDMGLGSSMVTLKTNQNGEQSIEKYYPPLKAVK